MNRKTHLYFGPPLALLTQAESNTLEISGKVNRTAERYLEILRYHGLELSAAERDCIGHVCGIGHMAPEEILALADEVMFTDYRRDDLDKAALVAKLEAASFADLVAMVESLGF